MIDYIVGYSIAILFWTMVLLLISNYSKKKPDQFNRHVETSGKVARCTRSFIIGYGIARLFKRLIK